MKDQQEDRLKIDTPMEKELPTEKIEILSPKNEKSPQIELKKIEPKLLEEDSMKKDDASSNERKEDKPPEFHRDREGAGMIESIFFKIKNKFSPTSKRKILGQTEKWNSFKKETDQKKKLHLNVYQFIKLKFKKLFQIQLTDDEKLFLKAEKIFHQEIDVIQILKKHQEVDRLKYLLLDKNQVLLFKFLERPIVNLDSEEKVSSRKTQGDITEAELREAYNYYTQLEKSSYRSNLDQKLMKLIDKRLKNLSNF